MNINKSAAPVNYEKSSIDMNEKGHKHMSKHLRNHKEMMNKEMKETDMRELDDKKSKVQESSIGNKVDLLV